MAFLAQLQTQLKSRKQYVDASAETASGVGEGIRVADAKTGEIGKAIPSRFGAGTSASQAAAAIGPVTGTAVQPSTSGAAAAAAVAATGTSSHNAHAPPPTSTTHDDEEHAARRRRSPWCSGRGKSRDGTATRHI